MEEIDRLNKTKLERLRNDIQAGIASGDAGTLDTDQLKRRARARQGTALRETEQRHDARQEQSVDAVAQQERRTRRE